jgi:acyl-CoA reductase-like NAD-dependent aldehyde dehydrogenase
VSGKMIRRSLFIDGARVAPAGAGVISVTDPAAEEGPRLLTGGVDAPAVRINNGAPNPLAALGGFRQSGHGREYGKFGLEEFPQPHVTAAVIRERA